MTPTVHLLLGTLGDPREEMACGVRTLNTQYSPPKVRALVFTRHARHVTCRTCRKRLRLARALLPSYE